MKVTAQKHVSLAHIFLFGLMLFLQKDWALMDQIVMDSFIVAQFRNT
jgi:hypothetical protein